MSVKLTFTLQHASVDWQIYWRLQMEDLSNKLDKKYRKIIREQLPQEILDMEITPEIKTRVMSMAKEVFTLAVADQSGHFHKLRQNNLLNSDTMAAMENKTVTLQLPDTEGEITIIVDGERKKVTTDNFADLLQEIGTVLAQQITRRRYNIPKENWVKFNDAIVAWINRHPAMTETWNRMNIYGISGFSDIGELDYPDSPNYRSLMASEPVTDDRTTLPSRSVGECEDRSTISTKDVAVNTLWPTKYFKPGGGSMRKKAKFRSNTSIVRQIDKTLVR